MLTIKTCPFWASFQQVRRNRTELVEFTPQGKFVAQFQVDPGPAGAAFGLAFSNDFFNFRFAAVNDNQNQLDIWNVRP